MPYIKILEKTYNASSANKTPKKQVSFIQYSSLSSHVKNESIYAKLKSPTSASRDKHH